MRVYIAYGWPEGKWHGKHFRESLRKAGYQNTNSLKQADIIVAHSAGCYMLPDSLTAKLILLIGIPNWPGRSLFKCTSEKVILEKKNLYWFQKTLFHILYGVSQPRRLFNAYRNHRKKYILANNAIRVLAIRNKHDTYMDASTNRKLSVERGWVYKDLEGQHDDLWQNPQPYLDLIKQNI